MKLKHILLIFMLSVFSAYTEAATELIVLRKTDHNVANKTKIGIAILPNGSEVKNANKKFSSLATIDKPEVKKQEVTTNVEQLADLHVQNSVQPEITPIGGTVTFTIAVNNKGPATSNSIISKINIPSSYAITTISVTQGDYNQTTKLWNVGSLEPWKRAIMTVVVIVVNDANLMTTAELISCSTTDPDSTPNNGIDTNGNGLIVDDRDDEDDGDGQDVIIKEEIAENTSSSDPTATDPESPESDGPKDKDDPNENGGNLPDYTHTFYTDIKMELVDGKDKIISYLDFDTMAMRMEYHSKGKNPDPVYWDQYGYIYSAESKGKYVKIHFKSFAKAMVGMAKAFTPQMDLPFKTPKVYDDVIRTIYDNHEVMMPIDTYPMMEWAFYYHPSWFEGVQGIVKETISCRGSNTCSRYLVVSGEGKGTYVVFDSEDYLAEIVNPDGAKAIYTYEKATVNLPPAQSFNFNFKN